MIFKKDVLEILKDIHKDVEENNWNGFETIHLVRGSVLGLAEHSDQTNEAADFEFIENFAKSADFSEEVQRYQLRSLWTAHCIKFDIEPDTGVYDGEIAALGRAIAFLPTRSQGFKEEWAEGVVFYEEKSWDDCFDLFMGAFLA